MDFANKRVCVVSQPMYFPWVGLLEQIRLSNMFVFYDDVQFSRGSFSNRVQVKTSDGMRWLTVPLRNQHLGQLINEVQIDNRSNWRHKHRELLNQAYANTPYLGDMLMLVDKVFANDFKYLADLSKASMLALVDYFGLRDNTSFQDSSMLYTPGHSSQRVIDLCLNLNVKTYLTGHGARHYLEHERFEAQGIEVVYIGYSLQCYPQDHGEFTPYVTALDLVANCGKEGASRIAGMTVPWREFITNQLN